jgi:Domain of unknown function (DUF4271)
LKYWHIAIFIICSCSLKAQVVTKSVQQSIIADTVLKLPSLKSPFKLLLDSNRFLNSNGIPVSLPVVPKYRDNNQLYFYLFTFLFLILGITRTLFGRYFSTLFRVFFNTTLKQNQLTDQLEQAKLPSLIFNIFFTIITGLYIYFLIKILSNAVVKTGGQLIFTCIAAVAICYAIKYLTLKATGWLTNYKSEANTYIFIIFLLNKMIGILLLPVITIMAFSNDRAVSLVVILSLILLAIIFLVRFYRSYAVLQAKLKVTIFHFLLYVTALEIIPILLIYKFVTLYLHIKP